MRKTPNAPEMLLTMLNSDSPVLPAPMESMYSSACSRVTSERLALRTRRLPATPTTPGSSKWRVALRTMSLSKEVSPSSAITTSPVAMNRPAFSDDTRPPRCHLGSTTRLRRWVPASSDCARRAARSVGPFCSAPSITAMISMKPGYSCCASDPMVLPTSSPSE